jgi:hypothetical protein
MRVTDGTGGMSVETAATGHNTVCLQAGATKMATENTVRALSNDEMDTVSGGTVCRVETGFSFLGVTFSFAPCIDGSYAGKAQREPSLTHEPPHAA